MKTFWPLALVISCVLQAAAAMPPVALRVEPAYPPLAWQAQLQGVVEVNMNGDVISAKASGAHQLLQRAAQENIRGWKFSNVNYDSHRFTIQYDYRILPTKQGQFGKKLPVKYQLPDRIVIAVYQAEVET